MSFNLRTNSIVGKNGEDPTTLPYGSSLSSGSGFNIQGNINVSGISTVSNVLATNASVSGIVTAASFVGDGSGLTGVQSVSSSKSIALKYIISDPPLRS